jgi:hypothetical protein
MQEETYKILRPDIQTGGFILYKGYGNVSRAIMLFTEWSHISIIVRFELYKELRNRIFVVEAVGKGLRPYLLSKKVQEYNGEMYLCQPEGLTQGQRDIIRGFAWVEACMGKPYDYKTFLKMALSHAHPDIRAYICSEIATQCLVEAKYIEQPKHVYTPAGLVKAIESTITKIDRKELLNVLSLA